MASIIFLLAVFLILAAILGTIATGLVRILGLGILALFAALVVNMAANGRLPNVAFRNPFSPSAQQIPTTTETSAPGTANFDATQPPSSNGGEISSNGSTTSGTATSSNPGIGPTGTGSNSNTTGTSQTSPQVTTSQPNSSRPGVRALW